MVEAPKTTGARGMRLAVAAALGAAAFFGLQVLFQLFWDDWFRPAELDQAWFLGSRRSIAATQWTVGGLAFVLGLGRRRRWLERLQEGGALAVGAAAAMALVFALLGGDRLLLGPGRLWPLSLAAGGVLLALPILAGTLAAGLVRGTR